jgi:hypothetical protein
VARPLTMSTRLLLMCGTGAESRIPVRGRTIPNQNSFPMLLRGDSGQCQ